MKYGPLIYARGVPNYYNNNLHWDYTRPDARQSIWYNEGELFPDRAMTASTEVQDTVHPIPIPAGSGTVKINIEPLTIIDCMINFYHIENDAWMADSNNTFVNNSGEITMTIPAGATHLTIGMRDTGNSTLKATMTVKQVTIDFE